MHTYIQTQTHMHTYIHTYKHTYKHIYIHTHINTYTITYIHTHTNIHTYIHTHTYIQALCILTGTTPIELKAEEAANLYRITRDKQNHQLDHEVEPKDWTHPADSVKINEQTEGNEHTIQIFTDGSKNEHGVGSGTDIYIHRTN